MVACVTYIVYRGLPCNPCALSVLRAYSERATFAQRLLTCGARDRVSVKVILIIIIVIIVRGNKTHVSVIRISGTQRSSDGTLMLSAPSKSEGSHAKRSSVHDYTRSSLHNALHHSVTHIFPLHSHFSPTSPYFKLTWHVRRIMWRQSQLMLTNPRDAFRGQPRSPNIVPFPYVRYSFLLCNSNFDFKTSRFYDIRLQKWKNDLTLKTGLGSVKVIGNVTMR